jgi:hypothetical protein
MKSIRTALFGLLAFVLSPTLLAAQSLPSPSYKNLIVTGTFNTNALPASPLVGTTDTQTLTNKTLVTPVIGAATGTSLQLSGLAASSFVSTDGSKNLITSVAPVTTFNSRSGAVVPASGDYSTSQLTTSVSASVPGAGQIGQVLSCSALSGAATTLTTSTAANVPNCNPMALTAGNWECSGASFFTTNAGGTVTALNGWISLTSATLPTSPNSGAQGIISGISITVLGTTSQPVPPFFVRSASSVNVFLSGSSSFSGTAPALYGAMNCIRTN